MPATHKVSVPKTAGDEIVITFGGDPDSAVTYKVTDGQTTVRDEHLASFVSAIEGSAVVGDTAAKNRE